MNEVYIKSDFNICYYFVFIVAGGVKIKKQFPSASLVSFVSQEYFLCLADQKC